MKAAAIGAALLRKHAALQEQINLEHARPTPDTLRLTALKRQRLIVKDKLARQSPLRTH